jgi:hypothetical protein
MNRFLERFLYNLFELIQSKSLKSSLNNSIFSGIKNRKQGTRNDL